MTPRAVLLDAGGTLISLDYGGLAGELGVLGVATTREELLTAESSARAWANDEVNRGAPPESLWNGYFSRMLAHAGLGEPERSRLIERLWERNVTEGLWRTPIPGAASALQTLRERGFRLAVVSNAEGRVEEDLRDAGLRGFLELVVDSHLVGVSKPDPEIFRLALSRLDLDPASTIYVGDVYAIDVVGARAAGIEAVLIDASDQYPDADCRRIHSVADLPSLLDGAPQEEA